MLRFVSALAAVLLVTACGSSTHAPSTTEAKASAAFTVRGELDLSAAGDGVLANTGQAGSPCIGQNGYDDIKQGAQVVVRDDAGKSVGIGTLNQGLMSARVSNPDSSCMFYFEVPGVRSKAAIMSVEVAKRGQIQFKRQQSQEVSLTLGP